MKYLRKFDSVSDMETAIASSEIGILGLAYNGSTPVMWIKSGGSPVPPTPSYSTPLYVENITQENETLNINLQLSGFEYSYDCETWTYSDDSLDLDLNTGEKIYLRSELMNNGANNISGMSKVGGNIMSLIYADVFTGEERSFPEGSNSIFTHLFSGNESLIDASELILPATTLASNCYGAMFSGCTALTTAPALPATTLAWQCYGHMFDGCTNLEITPTFVPASRSTDAYIAMYANCPNLLSYPVPDGWNYAAIYDYSPS